MSRPAYDADFAMRAELVARLRAHAAAGRLHPGPLAWTGAAGSLVGCLLESEDLAQWQDRLGLPQWLAVAADAIAANQPTLAQAEAFGVALLEAIRPGADLATVGSRLVLRVLTDMARSAGTIPGALAESVERVAQLHQRAAAGQAPQAHEWRAVRKAASGVTDTLDEGPVYDLSVCTENAAWDPGHSSAAVYDTMRVWENAYRAQATREAGWTDEIDAAMHARLHEMFEVHMGGVQGPTITVFDMLKKYHPEEHEVLLGRNKIDEEVNTVLNARSGALLMELLRAA